MPSLGECFKSGAGDSYDLNLQGVIFIYSHVCNTTPKFAIRRGWTVTDAIEEWKRNKKVAVV
jgi:hypothetical protein